MSVSVKEELVLCDAERCLIVYEDGDSVRIETQLSLQQRVSLRLRSPQIDELIDWLVDRHPNGKD